MILDLSGNGNFADEASLLVALATVAGIFLGGSKIGRRIRRIDHAVNNVDVPCEDDSTATLGQRIVRLEGTHHEHHKMLRSVADALHEHVEKANYRHERIEQKLDDVMGRMNDVRKVGN